MIAMIGLSIPIWSSFFRYCVFKPIELEPQFNQGQPMSCDIFMVNFPSFLAFFFPVLGVGIWIIIFGIQDRSMVTFKKKA